MTSSAPNSANEELVRGFYRAMGKKDWQSMVAA